MAKLKRNVAFAALCSAAALFAVAGSGCSNKQTADNSGASGLPAPPPPITRSGAPVASAPGVVGDSRSNVATPDVIARMAKEKSK